MFFCALNSVSEKNVLQDIISSRPQDLILTFKLKSIEERDGWLNVKPDKGKKTYLDLL